MSLGWDTIGRTIMPLIAAQFFFCFLVYFTLIRKQMPREYPFYALFLCAIIFFLGGRMAHLLPLNIPGYYILHPRMLVLMAVGFPSLSIAAALHSGFTLSRRQIVFPYVAGLCLSLLQVTISDAAWANNYGESLGIGGVLANALPLDFYHARIVLIFSTVVLLLAPCAYLLLRPLQQKPPLAYIAGIMLFGVFMILGVSFERFSIYYTGSLVSAFIWGGAVYRDLREMKGKSTLLKEELQVLVRSGRGQSDAEIEQLLKDLEVLSSGNLDVYKMRVREILGMLTDATIDAGGEPESLLQRNKARSEVVESARDAQAIREMIREEALELSHMVAAIPEQKKSELVERAKAFIAEHHQESIGVGDVAAHLSVSQSYLMAVFKKNVGITINQYLTGLRIEKAQILLRTTTVTETAFEVGFNNSNYFSTVFKRQTGMTPKDYQKRAKGSETAG